MEKELNQSLPMPPFPWFGVDIGGTLTKLVYFDPEPIPENDETASDSAASASLSVSLSLASSKASLSDETPDTPDSGAQSSSLASVSARFSPQPQPLLQPQPSSVPPAQTHSKIFERLFLANVRRYLMSSRMYGATGVRDSHLELRDVVLHGRRGQLHFIRFPTNDVPKFIDLAREKNLKDVAEAIWATGGGAYKFEGDLRERLQMSMHKFDEIAALLDGIDFIYKHRPLNECYYWEQPGDIVKGEKRRFDFSQPYPYLCVNVGSGVSILAVQAPGKYTRVSGTSIGGGTFLGLCSLLTGCTSFEEAIELAVQGDHTKVDKLVRDIYGGGYARFNLPAGVVAASFGHMHLEERRAHASPADLARATLVTVTNNISSIALMCARQEKIDRIVFVGNFFRSMNSISMRSLAAAMEFWSQGTKQALFLEHEGYFGAVGCLLKLLCHGPEPESDRTGLASPPADAPTPIDPLDRLASRARLAPDDQPLITISPFFPSPSPAQPTPTQLANCSSATSASRSHTTNAHADADASRNAGGASGNCASPLVTSTSGVLSSSPGASASAEHASALEVNRGGS